jgi:prepilin-type processing-associated H-X9-DG protein/prepilin-type N-terminal cleavage/methylation domain-containing protein
MTPTSTRKASYASGFTLIELMVVIGIIALLIAMLLPAIGKARAQSKSTACQSNLHQINTAMTVWHTQQAMHDSIAAFSGGGWPSLVYPYLESKGVYLCQDEARDIANIPATPNAYIVIQNNGFNIPLDDGPWAIRKDLGPYSYELDIEDGGDLQYNDVHLTVTDNRDGTCTITLIPNSGNPSYIADLYDSKTKKIIWANLYKGSVKVGATTSVSSSPPTSYGFSSVVSSTEGRGDKVIACDYPHTQVFVDFRADDWTSIAKGFGVAGSGSTTFARHSGGFNVLWGDGHIEWVPLMASNVTKFNPVQLTPGTNPNWVP